jgi:CheY-like chemotaxis protein
MPAAAKTIDETFPDVVRYALNHLYDPEQLRTSLLIQLLALDGQHQPAGKLQQLLLDAIQALRPPSTEPAGSAKRRIHQVLQLRYEQQFAQKEVATQLGLSVRQFRRLQQVALESLAAYLADTYALEDRFKLLPAMSASGAAEPPVAELPESLQWMRALSPTEFTDLDRAIADVLRLVQPLAEGNHKRLVWCGDERCVAALHPLVFRQALLHLLNTAILHTGGNTVVLEVACERLQVSTRVLGGRPCAVSGNPAGANDEEGMVREMLQACRATVSLGDHGDGWGAELRCKRVQEQPVLVVDDHPETVELLQRCLEGTRYRMLATQEPQRALDLALEEQPFVILLDVMMPDVDGWEVLTRLKQHEATAAIPVWVCTVLDQSELALSLGADGFVRKPVTREALLALLDAQAVREPAPH